MSKYTLLLLALLFPAISNAQAISNEEIDRFLGVLPEVAKEVDSIADQLLNSEDRDKSIKVQKAKMTGLGNQTLVELEKDSPELKKVQDSVEKFGYDSIEDWAYVGDRIESVLFANTWIVAMAKMQDENTPLERGQNMFAYVEDESIDAATREEHKDNLIDLCQNNCAVFDDLWVVGARYDEIVSAYDAVR